MVFSMMLNRIIQEFSLEYASQWEGGLKFVYLQEASILKYSFNFGIFVSIHAYLSQKLNSSFHEIIHQYLTKISQGMLTWIPLLEIL